MSVFYVFLNGTKLRNTPRIAVNETFKSFR